LIRYGKGVCEYEEYQAFSSCVELMLRRSSSFPAIITWVNHLPVNALQNVVQRKAYYFNSVL
jgi:hypothetical protein